MYCQAGDMNVKITWTCAFAAPDKERSSANLIEPMKRARQKMPQCQFTTSVSECQFSDYGLENGKTYYYV
ncbi:MAG: hypothetical protein R2883_08670 [Caldisericia bacterium]